MCNQLLHLLAAGFTCLYGCFRLGQQKNLGRNKDASCLKKLSGFGHYIQLKTK